LPSPILSICQSHSSSYSSLKKFQMEIWHVQIFPGYNIFMSETTV
jgi:hypothetical protein